jgi:alpha-galactosidase
MKHARIASILIGCLFAVSVQALQLNIQINGHNSDPQGNSDPVMPNYQGAGAIGGSGDLWNHVAADSYGHALTIITPEKLLAADGTTVTRAQLAFTGFVSADYFPPNQGAPVENNLLNGYLVYRAGASITIGGLIPKAAYDLYVFGSNSRAGAGGEFSVNGSAPQFTRADNSGTVFAKGVDFVAFERVAADSRGRLIVTANPHGSDIGILNGLQLSGDLPAPTAESLLPDAKRFALAKFAGEPDERSQFSTDPLFSFLYGGQSSGSLLDHWKISRTERELDANRTEHVITWTDPQTGLEVRCVGIAYGDFPTVEWTPYLKDTGTNDTPIIEDFSAIDTPFTRGASGEFVLNYQRGSEARQDDFMPMQETMTPNTIKQLATSGGRSSEATLPYFNVEWPGGGVIMAVGWPGEWSATFARDGGNGLNVKAGQELTHFRLHPGEEVRGPLIALQFYQGDRIDAQNVWRRWMLAHNVPRVDGKLPPVTWMACSSHQFNQMDEANEANQDLFIDLYQAKGLTLDYWWMDAGWYPDRGVWVNTGTWEPDKTRFPNGLRGISDHARAKGVKTLVWFEPERVTSPSWLSDNHPEWLLKPVNLPPDLAYESIWRLLNLGNPEAHAWLVDHIDHLLKNEGIDFYRQDFNMSPLYNWRANDAEDRQGITEIKYVTGYLSYWDELRRRNPNLRIDSCASGGRRLDLETMRRAVSLTRSDYLFEPTGEQGHTYGLAFWLPYNGSGFNDRRSMLTSKIAKADWLPADGSRQIESDSYLFRSVMGMNITAGIDIRDKQVDFPTLRKLYKQWKKVAPNFCGDFYPLTSYNLDESQWMAWQFDRPEAGEGIIQAFRRHDSIYESARFKLRGLDRSASYLVTDMDTDKTERATGQELLDQGVDISLPGQPAAALIHYQKVSP